MTAAKTGDQVSVHYKGMLENGEIFDSSEGRAPLNFTLGQNEVIAGFDTAVQGMSPGETCTVRVASENAYGPHRNELVHTVERSTIPEDLDLETGQILRVRDSDGRPAQLTVIDVDDEHVTLDGNHPLAGKDLTFEIRLVSIV
jgi:peptidylprolyl isomerase